MSTKLETVQLVDTSNGRIINSINHHNHVPDAAKLQVRNVLTDLKEMCSATRDSTHTIVAEITANLSGCSGPATFCGKYKKYNQKAAAAERQLSSESQFFDGFAFSPEYTVIKHEHLQEAFLQFDSGPGLDCIVIFSARQNLDMLSQ